MMKQYGYLSSAQLYAVEQKARRERAKAQARFFLAAVRWAKELFKTIFARPHTARPLKGVRHA